MKILIPSAKKHKQSFGRKASKGFTIVEVAIAMGIVTLLMTTFLGVFGPAQKNIQRALNTKDINRMKDMLSEEMTILRSTDSDSSSFHKAFRMIKGSYSKSSAVLIYQYRAQPEDDDHDGILPAFTGDDGIQGLDYIVQTAVRSLGEDDAKIRSELAVKVVDGPVFVVKMSQLIKDTSASTSDKLVLKASESGNIVNTNDNGDPGDTASDPDSYTSAIIAFRADFYKLSSNKYEYITSNNWNFSEIGNPLTEINMAVSR